MRIYEGSPRQDWEEVLRSVGAWLDDRGMRDVVFLEKDDGFIIQGTAVDASAGAGEQIGLAKRETLTVLDDQAAKFMDDAMAQRGKKADPTPKHYEAQLRVIGRFLDDRHPRDLFFFEIDGAYVCRLTQPTQTGLKHELVEFTRDDIADLIAKAPALRRGTAASGSPAKPA